MTRTRGRFMESRVGAGAMPTDLEPGRIPGGETPPSTAGETPAATDARFMESRVGEGALLTDLESETRKSLDSNEIVTSSREAEPVTRS